MSRKKKEDQKRGSPAWMTTFGDMMTLLLVFFVLLYSFSVMDLDKFEGFISALQNKLGVLDGGQTLQDSGNIARGDIGEKFTPARQGYAKVMSEISQYIEENNLQEQVQMRLTDRGLILSLTGQILYDLGEAVIKPQGREVLNEVALTLKEVPNEIIVEGHTDNIPINTSKFPTNWELSTTRATNVIRYFIEEHEVNPRRLSAAGYSKYRPLYANETSEQRAKNRRVQIVILDSTPQKAEEIILQEIPPVSEGEGGDANGGAEQN